MTQNVSADFFANEGSGLNAPGFKPRGVGDGVMGEIKEIRQVDYYKFGEKTPEILANGSTRQQLRVIVQGPVDNYATTSGQNLPVDEHNNVLPDTGLRTIFLPSGSNISGAVKAACITAGARGLDEGGQLGVKLVEEKDTGKGNPLKIWEAKYTAPSKSAGFDFGAGQQQAAPPAQQQGWQQPAPQQAAPAQQAWQQPAPSQAAPPAQQPQQWAQPAPQAAPQQQWQQPAAPVAPPQQQWAQQPPAQAPAAAPQQQWAQPAPQQAAPAQAPAADPWAQQQAQQPAAVPYPDEPPF